MQVERRVNISCNYFIRVNGPESDSIFQYRYTTFNLFDLRASECGLASVWESMNSLDKYKFIFDQINSWFL